MQTITQIKILKSRYIQTSHWSNIDAIIEKIYIINSNKKTDAYEKKNGQNIHLYNKNMFLSKEIQIWKYILYNMFTFVLYRS